MIYTVRYKDLEPRYIWAPSNRAIQELVEASGKGADIYLNDELVASTVGVPIRSGGPTRCGECGWETAYRLRDGGLGCWRCGWRC